MFTIRYNFTIIRITANETLTVTRPKVFKFLLSKRAYAHGDVNNS